MHLESKANQRIDNHGTIKLLTDVFQKGKSTILMQSNQYLPKDPQQS